MSAVTPKTLARDLRQRIKVIDRELASVRSLIEERARLSDALRRLAESPSHSPSAVTGTAAGGRRRARRRRRGSNREDIVKFLGELGRPATATEVATATGIPRASVATMLSTLAKKGDLTKAERGYALNP